MGHLQEEQDTVNITGSCMHACIDGDPLGASGKKEHSSVDMGRVS